MGKERGLRVDQILDPPRIQPQGIPEDLRKIADMLFSREGPDPAAHLGRLPSGNGYLGNLPVVDGRVIGDPVHSQGDMEAVDDRPPVSPEEDRPEFWLLRLPKLFLPLDHAEVPNSEADREKSNEDDVENPIRLIRRQRWTHESFYTCFSY